MVSKPLKCRVFNDKAKNLMKKAIVSTKKDMHERGFALKGRGENIVNAGRRCRGETCSVVISGRGSAGQFHTHPHDNPNLSIGDVASALIGYEPMTCVGVVAKSPYAPISVTGKPVTFCYLIDTKHPKYNEARKASYNFIGSHSGFLSSSDQSVADFRKKYGALFPKVCMETV